MGTVCRIDPLLLTTYCRMISHANKHLSSTRGYITVHEEQLLYMQIINDNIHWRGILLPVELPRIASIDGGLSAIKHTSFITYIKGKICQDNMSRETVHLKAEKLLSSKADWILEKGAYVFILFSILLFISWMYFITRC